MSKTYIVNIKQIFTFPIEVVADDEDDAIDSVRIVPDRYQKGHEFHRTCTPDIWDVQVIDNNVPESKQGSHQIVEPDMAPQPTLDYQEVSDVMNKFCDSVKEQKSWAYVTGVYEGMLKDVIMGYGKPSDILDRMRQILTDLNKELDTQSN